MVKKSNPSETDPKKGAVDSSQNLQDDSGDTSSSDDNIDKSPKDAKAKPLSYNKPYDRAVNYFLSHFGILIAFLKVLLTPKIRDYIDLYSLQSYKSIFVTSTITEIIPDMTYIGRSSRENNCKIILMIEHLTKNDDNIIKRCQECAHEIAKELHNNEINGDADEDKPLSIAVIVLHQGGERLNIKTKYMFSEEKFDINRDECFQFQLTIMNLLDNDVREIKSTPGCELFLCLLQGKYIIEDVNEFCNLIVEKLYNEEKNVNLIEQHGRFCFNYLFSILGDAAEPVITNAFRGIYSEEEVTSMSMSIIESAEARGMSKGLAKGLAKGRAEGRAESLVDVIIRVLSKKYGPSSISTIENAIKASNGKSDLNELFDLAYETTSLEDFIQKSNLPH